MSSVRCIFAARGSLYGLPHNNKLTRTPKLPGVTPRKDISRQTRQTTALHTVDSSAHLFRIFDHFWPLEIEVLIWRPPGGTHLSNFFLPLLQRPSQPPHADDAPKAHSSTVFVRLKTRFRPGDRRGRVPSPSQASLHSCCPTQAVKPP